MPPRATWKGHMKLSLVSFAVRVYNATSSAGRVSLNQLHKDCHQRLKQKLACPEHGDVERSDIEKGYEFEKDRYVVVTAEELEKLEVPTTKTIDITQFIDRDEIDSIYLNSPYFVAPDGPVAEQAYSVLREAMRAANKLAIGQFTTGGKEHIVVIDVEERGFRMTTVRSDAEVRSSDAYFEDIRDAETDPQQVQLAQTLIEQYSRPLDKNEFKDRYQEALLELITAKVEGRDPEIVQAEEIGKTLNFMDALKASLVESGVEPEAAPVKKKVAKKPPAASVKKKKVVRKKKGA